MCQVLHVVKWCLMVSLILESLKLCLLYLEKLLRRSRSTVRNIISRSRNLSHRFYGRVNYAPHAIPHNVCTDTRLKNFSSNNSDMEQVLENNLLK